MSNTSWEEEEKELVRQKVSVYNFFSLFFFFFDSFYNIIPEEPKRRFMIYEVADQFIVLCGQCMLNKGWERVLSSKEFLVTNNAKLVLKSKIFHTLKWKSLSQYLAPNTRYG